MGAFFGQQRVDMGTLLDASMNFALFVVDVAKATRMNGTNGHAGGRLTFLDQGFAPRTHAFDR